MKKNFKIIFASILAAAMLCGCGEQEPKQEVKQEPNHYSLDAKTDGFDTLKEMEDYSALIVRGVRQDREENNIIKKEGVGITATYSYSEFQVMDIFKDDSGTVQAGDTITILENEAYDEEKNVVYHVAGYNKMVVGDEYLLFLRECQRSDGETYYVSAGVNYGTISLQEDQRTRSYKNEIGTGGEDFGIYKDIWQEAKEKYIN